MTVKACPRGTRKVGGRCVPKMNQDIINKFKNIKDDIAVNLIDADDRSKDRVLLEMDWLLEEMEGK